jgi:uncharacterized membrane protein
MKIAISPIEPVAVITTTWRMIVPWVSFGAGDAVVALMGARFQICGRVSTKDVGATVWRPAWLSGDHIIVIRRVLLNGHSCACKPTVQELS